MKIVDFMVSTGKLAEFNYVMVDDNEENIAELMEMGCSLEEIASMRCDYDNLLDVYPVLNKKGYQYIAYSGNFVKNGIEEGV